MGENLAGDNASGFLLVGITIALCVFVHIIYKNFFNSKKKEEEQCEAETNSGAQSEEASSDNALTESRTSNKTKKRATWKGKSEFSHPWLLKNLKGHPGTVLLVDFSANGKFMAATCDGAQSEEASSDNALTESRTSNKTKKRATWKGKSEFSHPWLLKNLKGHPGTVLLVDFSANGKFMAATCDGAQSEEASSDNALTESRTSNKTKKRATWKGKSEFSHPWLLKNLKGHPGTVLLVDFSANGKFMAATCDDGSVILWDVKDLNAKEHKTLRVNIEFDHASHVAWSPDSKAFIVHKVRDNNIVVYKIEKKKDGGIASATPGITFDKVHEDDVIGFDISSNGKYMMSCTNKTDMVIWDLKGSQLDRLDTYLMSTHSAKISPCGRFVVASGFAPDIKVMEVIFAKNGDFKQVSKAYELSGHSSGIYDVAFDVDTSHIATISKDGTWKLFHTKINYTQGESPHVLETGSYTQTANPPHIALSPNAEVLAVSVDNAVEFYDTYTGELYDTVENMCSGIITHMKFDASGKYLFVCGDRIVRILHNVCGYHTTIASCQRLLAQKQTSATVERLKKTIEECKKTLSTFGK